jgi:hypothetical protein
MTTAPSNSHAGILVVDDGELDEVAAVLEAEGLAYERMRGGRIPAEIPPPRDLLIVTPRHAERVRRGSPSEASPGRPLRIIAVQEDSPPMRRRLRQAGLHLLVRLPADAEIWRLLIARALYQGSERRNDQRVAVGSRVAIDRDTRLPEDETTTILVDLSNRGCRLQTRENLSAGDAIAFTLPADHDAIGDGGPFTLRGCVRRIATQAGSEARMLAVVFDPDMSDKNRTQLTALINRWASGPASLAETPGTIVPAIPACQLPSLPDLTLDDETDPPVPAPARAEIRVQLADATEVSEVPGSERRSQTRGRYVSSILADGHDGPVVLIGQDLSAKGMRIERIGGLELGDRFRVALHGPNPAEPFIVHAEITRDDGEDGFALVFEGIDPAKARELEKLVACLPDVESIDPGEIVGLGAILSEILLD